MRRREKIVPKINLASSASLRAFFAERGSSLVVVVVVVVLVVEGREGGVVQRLV